MPPVEKESWIWCYRCRGRGIKSYNLGISWIRDRIGNKKQRENEGNNLNIIKWKWSTKEKIIHYGLLISKQNTFIWRPFSRI